MKGKMKITIYSILFLLCLIGSTHGQLKEHDNLMGGTIGLWAHNNSPIFGLNYEHQFSQLGDIAVISLGGVFRYSTFKNFYSDQIDYDNYTFTTFGIQSNLNFNNIGEGKFVPFVGLVLGYNNVSYSFISHNGIVYTSSINSGLWLWGQAGIRYFFSPNVAGVLRFGAGNFNFDVIELGVDFKF
jgi:hypothetical protein